MSIVERARCASGCLDIAVTADLIDDPDRVNLSSAGSRKPPSKPSAAAAPGFEHAAAMISVSIAEYDIAAMRPLFGGGTAWS